ncbi:MAG: DegT/DnrJ/EryC1/StrS family aminotransferase [Actinomycetes bacterium]
MSGAAVAAAVRVLRSGHLAQGHEVAAFEHEFGEQLGHRYCVAVNSGTTALWLTLSALGIGPGDEVITTAFTFGATAAAIHLTGATTVFADIDADTLCLDPAAAAAAITPRTAAIMPVHLYGHPAPMDQITDLATRYGLAVVEDAAQAHGASLRGTPTGAFGHAGAFSFYATKNMTSIEGGMITTADAELAHRARLLRNQGMDTDRGTPYHYDIVGVNGRMNDVAAAVARTELAALRARTDARRRHATQLNHNLAALPGIRTPIQRPGAQHVYHQYVIRLHDGPPRRTHLQRALRHARISSAVHYPVPLHRSRAYFTNTNLPNSDLAARQVLSLPVHPALAGVALDRIINTVASALVKRASVAAMPDGAATLATRPAS